MKNSKQWTDICCSYTCMHGFVDVANVLSTTPKNCILVMETDHTTRDIWLRTPSLGPTNFIQLIKCVFNSITIFLQQKYMSISNSYRNDSKTIKTKFIWIGKHVKIPSMPMCYVLQVLEINTRFYLLRSKWITNPTSSTSPWNPYSWWWRSNEVWNPLH